MSIAALAILGAPEAFAADLTIEEEVTRQLARIATLIETPDGAWIDPFVSDGIRVVFVGEEVHGVAEHLELKRELARRLVTHHGFTHVLFEDDVYKGDALDAALRADPPTRAADAMRSFFWCWNVTQIHALFDRDPGLGPLPIIGGIDVQTGAFALSSLETEIVSEEQRAAFDRLDAIFAGGNREYAATEPGEKAADARRIADAAARFTTPAAARVFAHLGRVHRVRSAAAEHGPRMKAREAGMAESLMDVLDADPHHRVVVFVHDAHGGYTPFYESFTGGVVPVAARVREEGAGVLSVGAVFATGSVLLDPRARDDEGGAIRTHETPPEGSQAAFWIGIPHGRWLIDLRSAAVSGSEPLHAFLHASPAGYFENYGPARPLADTYDLLVGYRRVTPATPPEP